MPSLGERIKHGWNAFLGRDPTMPRYSAIGSGSYYRPDRYRVIGVNATTLVNFIYNRIAVDVSQIDFKHCRVDSDGRYRETLPSELNNCLTLSANIDQTGRALIQDIVMSMFNEGVVAVVPVDTTADPNLTQSYDIGSIRVGKIIEWYPKHVKVHLYNEEDGQYHDIVVPKKSTLIIENPFYSIMNEPNSTLQQLVRTIARLNSLNDQYGSDKLNLIIQLPYAIKTQTRRDQAEERRKDIEDQLKDSRYGVAYVDSTERITQLNRALENNLWDQVKELTTQLYNQLGLTQGIFDGTANPETMLNYQNSSIMPVCTAITDEMNRKWISRTAYTQGQRTMFFRDPFKLTPVEKLADIADKFTRNEIMTSNELRTEIGMKPSDDPDADRLRNKNLNKSNAELQAEGGAADAPVDDSTDTTESEAEVSNVLSRL